MQLTEDIYQLFNFLIIQLFKNQKRPEKLNKDWWFNKKAQFYYVMTSTMQEFLVLTLRSDKGYPETQYYYPTNHGWYIALRYTLMVFVYFIFSSDWKSIAQTIHLFKDQFPEIGNHNKFSLIFLILLRVVIITFNEWAVLTIILAADLGDAQGLGLIKDFTSACIIC